MKHKMHGPVMIYLKILLINEDTDQRGEVTINMPPLQYLTQESIAARLEEFESQELATVAPGFRLMNKKEAFDYTCAERLGASGFALPGGVEWDNIDGESQ